MNFKTQDFRRRFPGLERRSFQLNHKFISLQSIDIEAQQKSDQASSAQKIGFFRSNINLANLDSSSDDEYSGGGANSDSRYRNQKRLK